MTTKIRIYDGIKLLLEIGRINKFFEIWFILETINWIYININQADTITRENPNTSIFKKISSWKAMNFTQNPAKGGIPPKFKKRIIKITVCSIKRFLFHKRGGDSKREHKKITKNKERE